MRRRAAHVGARIGHQTVRPWFEIRRTRRVQAIPIGKHRHSRRRKFPHRVVQWRPVQMQTQHAVGIGFVSHDVAARFVDVRERLFESRIQVRMKHGAHRSHVGRVRQGEVRIPRLYRKLQVSVRSPADALVSLWRPSPVSPASPAAWGRGSRELSCYHRCHAGTKISNRS